jgi:hypothetical protein
MCNEVDLFPSDPDRLDRGGHPENDHEPESEGFECHGDIPARAMTWRP